MNDTTPITKEEALDYHKKYLGKVHIETTGPLETKRDLALAYTPGVGMVSRVLAENPERVWELTGRRNRVAIVSDGTAVLGLGDIGPEGAMPVMEGKAALFKKFGGVDAIPLCLNTKDTDAIVEIVAGLEPSFGGINLEDISAPRCFEIERRLRERMNIPVFHDDQHGTAIVVLAGLLNAINVSQKSVESLKLVINGAGAAGTAIAHILLAQGFGDIIVLDSKGALSATRADLNEEKQALLALTNPRSISGDLSEVLKGADIFIGVSAANILTKDHIQLMAPNPIIFALANPDPEILPHLALEAGASVVATGRSDFANQVNNALAFPGIFRGALDSGVPQITESMKLAAARALADFVSEPSSTHILPDVLDAEAQIAVAKAVRNAA